MAITLEMKVPGPLEVAGVATFVSTIIASSDVQLASASLLSWNTDTYLARLGAANLRQGNVPSATPVAQILTLGEASRAGTDNNTAGANGTIQSGLGTGTGTVSSLIFQTPTVAGAGSGAQSYATRLTLDSSAATLTVPIVLGAFGTAWLSATGVLGILLSGNVSTTVSSANSVMYLTATGAVVGSGRSFLWAQSGDPTDTVDLQLSRLAAASLRQGLAPSATPVAQTFTLGEASRPGTDSNVGGASGTLRSGLGTGTGTASSLIFQTPTVAASGTGVQSYTTRLTLSEAGAVFDLVNQGLRINGQSDGAGAGVGTLTNTPNAGGGNPAFWLPVNIAGTVRYIPCWAA